MKVGVLSDLHLSRAPQPAPVNNADVYIVAGDIGRPAQAVAWAAELPAPVLYVPGNHEFYGGSLSGVVSELRQLARGTRVHILDNEEVTLGGVRFIGSTLWSDFLLDGPGAARDAAMMEAVAKVHDFRRIFVDEDRRVPFTPFDAAALFERNAAWLDQRLQRPWPGPTVVITHHAPCSRSIDPRFIGSPLNGCFASNLAELFDGGRAALWIHGHVHHSCDYVLQGTRVVCNPRGYASSSGNENPRFDINCSVEVA